MPGTNLSPETLIRIIRSALAAHDKRHPRDRSLPLSLDDVSASARDCEPMPMYAFAMLGWAAATLEEWAADAEAMDRAGAMLADFREIAGIAGQYGMRDTYDGDESEEDDAG